MTEVPASAVYVYCVVRSARRPSIPRSATGIPQGSRPEAVDLSGALWLIVADVPLAIYGPAALEPRLGDLDWVARIAVAHESVVEHLARRQDLVVVPMTLFTMFTTRAKAFQDVSRRRRLIQATMRRIAGCQEWGIRVTRVRGGSTDPAAAITKASGAPGGTGAAFLMARKAARDASVEARAAAAAAAARAFTRLAGVAKDSSRRSNAREPGTNPPMLEAAFLVPARLRSRFTAEARRQAAACAAAGAEMTLSGPWPAYNFAGAGGPRS